MLAKHRAKRLSVAVWILAILLCSTLLLSFVVIRALSTAPSGFSRLSSVEQIRGASVIAFADWHKSGSTLQCMISEIVKKTPGTTFYYKVGDEVRRGNQRLSEAADYGDGQVLFFTGSPATFQSAVTYRNGHITAMGDMPISEFRDVARKSSAP
jgi:hypothetical protein